MVALVAVAAFSLAAPTSAQDDPRAEFIAGAEAYQNGQYEEALVHFDRSYSLNPVPVVLFNKAQTLRELQRFPEAIEAYEEFLAAAPDDERRDAVLDVVSELEQEVGTINVTANVPGAEIFLDGERIGVSPTGPVRVTRGLHNIEARADGYHETSQTELVERGNNRVRLSLERIILYGMLEVRANVHPAIVSVDGREIGTAPINERVEQGARSIQVSSIGWGTVEQEVDIPVDGVGEMSASLERNERLSEKWWLWAIVGAVVVGGAATAIGLTAAQGGDPLEGRLPTVTANGAP